MRTFETPGIGGIMLAPKTSEHTEFFINHSEAFFFHNIEECLTMINFLLSLKRQADRE